MANLTIKQLETLSGVDDGKTFREDGGIVAKVRAGVRGITVQFRFEYKFDGAKRDHRLGTWPKKSLAAIRAELDELDELRTLLAKRLDPVITRKAEKIEAQNAIATTIAEANRLDVENKTVDDLFLAWLSDGVSRQCRVSTCGS